MHFVKFVVGIFMQNLATKKWGGVNIAQRFVEVRHNVTVRLLFAIFVVKKHTDRLPDRRTRLVESFSVVNHVKPSGEMDILSGKNTQIGWVELVSIEKY